MKKLTALMLMISLNVSGHGEDKYGPNGGFIKMPGAFHTEVVRSDSQLKVYLLDINWKNPIVKNSSVQVVVQSTPSFTGQCVAKEVYFQCALPKSVDLNKKGELTLQVKRDKDSGTAIYALPLALKNNETEDHSGHH